MLHIQEIEPIEAEIGMPQRGLAYSQRVRASLSRGARRLSRLPLCNRYDRPYAIGIAFLVAGSVGMVMQGGDGDEVVIRLVSARAVPVHSSPERTSPVLDHLDDGSAVTALVVDTEWVRLVDVEAERAGYVYLPALMSDCDGGAATVPGAPQDIAPRPARRSGLVSEGSGGMAGCASSRDSESEADTW